MANKLKVGDKIIVITINNYAKYGTRVFDDCEITSVRHPWFTVKSDRDSTLRKEIFSISTMQSDQKGQSSNYMALISTSEQHEYLDKPKLLTKIRNSIGALSYERLKEIESKYFNN